MGIYKSTEIYAARRGKLVLVATLAFLAYSVSASMAVTDRADLAVTASGISSGALQLILWLVWALSLSISVFSTPGFLRWTQAERRRLNDELVRANRAASVRWAFGVLVVGAFVQCLQPVGLWTPPAWWPIAALSASLATAGIAFAVLDMRADG